MMKPKKLTRLVVTKDGRTKTISGIGVDAIPVGKPFILEEVDSSPYTSGFSPSTEDIERKLRNQKGIDAYCLGNPSLSSESFEDTAGGGHVPVKLVSCPIQLYRLENSHTILPR